jgi:hypothetical protein
MQPRELTILLLAGGTLIAIGLIPNLLDLLQDGIQNFSASLSSSFPRKHPQLESEKHPVRLWLVAIGLALILASLLDISK